MKNIAVFFGGVSVEHDVSIITGVLTVNSLDKEKYNGVPIYVDKSGKFYTGEALKDIDAYKNLQVKKLKEVVLLSADNGLYVKNKNRLKKLLSISVAINCMHGENGEDGSLAGLLNMSGIAFCSPDLLCSSVAMSKSFTKIFLKGIGVKALKSQTVSRLDEIEKVAKNLGFPLIIKPDTLGSSIGIKTARDIEELKKAVLYGLKFGKRVIVEKLIEDFKEINCAAYRRVDGKIITSNCERPLGKGETLSFDDKYVCGDRIFPADIDKTLSDKIKETTKKVYENLFGDGVIRIDYILKDGEIYLNEINTVPGSLSYYLFGDTLKEFALTLDALIISAQKKYGEKESFIRSFSSSILKPFGAKGSKHLPNKV